jgi:hypothetical protein
MNNKFGYFTVLLVYAISRCGAQFGVNSGFGAPGFGMGSGIGAGPGGLGMGQGFNTPFGVNGGSGLGVGGGHVCVYGVCILRVSQKSRFF